MKLGLGTVQFGLDYGISNSAGRVHVGDVAKIIEAATTAGIRLLDTAPAYGESEAVLGEVLEPQHEFRIVTKTTPLRAKSITVAAAKQVVDTFRRSLERLRQQKIYGLLVHAPADLLVAGAEHLYEALQRLKQEGEVEKIGASIYDAAQLDVIQSRFTLDIVQGPLSILDQRLLRNGSLTRLKALGVEFHARSAFLQGVLLSPEDRLPGYLSALQPLLGRYREAMKTRGLAVATGALGFLKRCDEVDYVLIGVDSLAQLEENLRAWHALLPEKFDFEEFACNDPQILNPGLWPQLNP